MKTFQTQRCLQPIKAMKPQRYKRCTLVMIGEGVRDKHVEITQLRGYLIDVTDALHRDLDAATRVAVELSAGSRAAIEQAKGALMVTYGLDEDEAFAVLRWHSQHHNIKLRDIAARITDRIADLDIVDLPADRKIAEILDQLRQDSTTPETPIDISTTDPGDTDERISA